MVRCIHNAEEMAGFKEGLLKAWRGKSPLEARKRLERPDVEVTSQKDKDKFLGRLETLSDECAKVYAQMEVRALAVGARKRVRNGC